MGAPSDTAPCPYVLSAAGCAAPIDGVTTAIGDADRLLFRRDACSGLRVQDQVARSSVAGGGLGGPPPDRE